MQTKMRLPYGYSVDLLGGTRITVLRPADRDPGYFVLRLQRIDYQEQLEDPLPEPVQEQPLQGEDREALPGEGGVGTPGPLPDALPQEREVVEGVGGDADLERAASLFHDETAFRAAAERALLHGFDAGFELGKRWLRQLVDRAIED